MENEKNQWHPAFYAAAELEFLEDRDVLTFEREHTLGKMPPIADLLIIKRKPDAVLHNEIGDIFSRYNIVEYKSPDDVMNIHTFCKTTGYAGLYAWEQRIEPMDITITLVREGKPKEMLRRMAENGMTVTRKRPGIYYVEGKNTFRTQVIVSGELPLRSHAWLKALTRNAQEADIEALLQGIRYAQKLTESSRDNIDAVINVSLANNRSIFDLINERSSENMSEVLREYMDAYINTHMKDALLQERNAGRAEGEAKGRAEGEAKGRAEGMIQMGIHMGMPLDEISQWLQKQLLCSSAAAQELLAKYS